MGGKYKCMLASELLSDSVTVEVCRDRLAAVSSFAETPFPFTEITGFYIMNGSVHINTEQYQIELEPKNPGELPRLFGEIWAAYNAMTVRSFLINEQPRFMTEGDYIYSDPCEDAEGHCKIALFGDCLFLLPPNPRARKIQLDYVREIEYSDSGFTAVMEDESYYTVMNVGYDIQQLQTKLRYRLSEKGEAVKNALTQVDRTIDKYTADSFAAFMSGGRAASFAAISACDQLFLRSLGTFIKESPASDYFMYFMERCLPGDLFIGMSFEKYKAVMWCAALHFTFDGTKAAVMSFSQDAPPDATVIFDFKDTVDDFFLRLNRGMEDVKYHCGLFSPFDPQIHGEAAFLYSRSPSLQYLKRHVNCVIPNKDVSLWKSCVKAAF